MKLWEANIRKVVPYTPGEQPNERGMIKLNTNENPYSPAPGVEKALKALDADTLRLYPDPTAGDLVHSIAAFYGLKDEQVFTGVGSDDVLAMCFLTFFNSEKPILFPDITYSFYDVWADLLRIPYERPALDEEFHIRKEDYFRENGGIVFPNPNAPTGVEMPLSEIEEIVRPCGLGKSKAKDISACMKMLKEQYGGKVPDDFDALLKLPGVGRKSANLIMGDVFGKPAIVTDTHCIRLVNRMGLVKDIKEPKKVEMELWKIIPPEEGNDFCHRLVEHGRDVCTARTNPHCDRCVLNDICATGKKLMKAEQKTK